MERDPSRRDRRADKGTLGKAQAFLKDNPAIWKFVKVAVISVLGWLLVVTVGVTIAIVKQRNDESRTRSQARTACVRAKQFGPAIANYYETHHVLDAKQLAGYRASIPKGC